MVKAKSDKLTLKHIIGYGCGDAGGCLCMAPIWGYMSRFLQVNLGINAALLATMLLVWNIWDAVNDPLMGTIMDMCYAKAKPGKDKFRPWVLWSIPVMFIGTVAFFVVPGNMEMGLTMMVAIFCLKIVSEGGYTMMNIAMGSLLGNMARNDTERATLASARGLGSTFGNMLGGVIAPLILAKFGTGNDGYAILAVVFVTLGCIVTFLHYAMTEERNKDAAVEKTEEEKAAEKFKLSDIWNIVSKNRAFLALILHSICICAIQALGTGAATYMFIDVLGDISLQSVSSGLSSALQFAILFSAPLLTKKWDLVAIIRFCLLVGAAAYAGLLAYTMLSANMNGMLYVVWNGLAQAMVVMSVQMQWGLVAETIDYNEYLTGKRNEGTIYGFFSLSRRVGTTIAKSATVILIAAIGYNTEAANAGLTQAPEVLNGIKAMVSGFPMIAAIGSFCAFTFIWNINKDVRTKMGEWKAAKAK